MCSPAERSPELLGRARERRDASASGPVPLGERRRRLCLRRRTERPGRMLGPFQCRADQATRRCHVRASRRPFHMRVAFALPAPDRLRPWFRVRAGTAPPASDILPFPLAPTRLGPLSPLSWARCAPANDGAFGRLCIFLLADPEAGGGPAGYEELPGIEGSLLTRRATGWSAAWSSGTQTGPSISPACRVLRRSGNCLRQTASRFSGALEFFGGGLGRRLSAPSIPLCRVGAGWSERGRSGLGVERPCMVVKIAGHRTGP